VVGVVVMVLPPSSVTLGPGIRVPGHWPPRREIPARSPACSPWARGATLCSC